MMQHEKQTNKQTNKRTKTVSANKPSQMALVVLAVVINYYFFYLSLKFQFFLHLMA